MYSSLKNEVGFTYFIYQFEYYFVYAGVKEAITFTIQAIGIWPGILSRHYNPGSFIKLRIDL